MPKYRQLLPEELLLFEKEFVDFLVVNGITADEWEGLKMTDKLKVEQITALFSDVIFEKIMRQTRFIDKIEPAFVQSVQCLDDKMIMVAISRKDPDLDLTKADFAQLDPDKIELVKGERKYVQDRQLELFEMISGGYVISDGSFFKTLILATV